MKKLLPLTALVALIGCNTDEIVLDNIQLPNLNGDYIFPLGDVTYRLDSLIEEASDSTLTLIVDPETSLISFYYADSVRFSSPDDLINIEPTDDTEPVDLTDEIGETGPGTVSISREIEFEYDATEDGELVDSIFYSQGFLEVTVNSTLNLSYEMVVENTRDVGTNQPARFIGSTDSPPAPLNLAEPQHKTILTTEDGRNIFFVQFDADIILEAGESIGLDDNIRITVAYIDQDFSILYGKFGQDTVQVDSTVIEISFFENIESDGLIFGNPMVRLDLENDFGIPFGLDFSTVFGDNGEGSVPFFLSGEVTETLQEIDGATFPAIPALDTVHINKTNSNLVSLLAESPSRLVFDVAAVSNPVEDPTRNNFIRQEDEINGAINILIPLEVEMENVEQVDTLKIGNDVDVSDLDSLAIRVVTDNGLPLTGLLTMEIVLRDTIDDDPYIVTDKLVLKSATVDVNGIVTQSRPAVEEVPISEEGVKKFEQGAYIITTLLLNTPGSQSSNDSFVQLLADYELTITIGLAGRVDIEL